MERTTRNTPSKIDTNKAASTKPLTPRQIVEKVLHSVVLIVAQDENGEAISQGSGFFYEEDFSIGQIDEPTRKPGTVDKDKIDRFLDGLTKSPPLRQKSGLVATNLHVFTRASQAYVKVLGTGIKYKVAEVVGIDMRRDLCVVRVDDASAAPLMISGSSRPAVGDDVYVGSNPEGLEGSFSKGIVSGIRKDAGLIQIDAAISHGSSGGVVVNTRAEVIGIVVSSVVGGQNLNFAVPVEYLLALDLRFHFPIVSEEHCRSKTEIKIKSEVRCKVFRKRQPVIVTSSAVIGIMRSLLISLGNRNTTWMET